MLRNTGNVEEAMTILPSTSEVSGMNPGSDIIYPGRNFSWFSQPLVTNDGTVP
jgi:hypothetical protein